MKKIEHWELNRFAEHKISAGEDYIKKGIDEFFPTFCWPNYMCIDIYSSVKVDKVTKIQERMIFNDKRR